MNSDPGELVKIGLHIDLIILIMESMGLYEIQNMNNNYAACKYIILEMTACH